MIAKEILGRPVRLVAVLILAVMASSVLHGNAGAAVIFSENFDSLAAGTVLTSANMPGWTFKGAAGGSTSILTTNSSAVSSPNAIRGSGAARGAMFHDVAGAVELRFDFFRRDQGNTGSSLATSEIGFMSSQALNIFNGPDGARVSLLVDTRSNDKVRFFSRAADNSVISMFDITSSLVDSTWYNGLIRLNPDNTASFGFKGLADANYTMSTGHALAVGFSPTDVGAALFEHNSTNGRAYLDNIVADDSVSVVPEPSSVVSWTALSLFGLFFTWRRRQRVA